MSALSGLFLILSHHVSSEIQFESASSNQMMYPSFVLRGASGSCSEIVSNIHLYHNTDGTWYPYNHKYYEDYYNGYRYGWDYAPDYGFTTPISIYITKSNGETVHFSNVITYWSTSATFSAGVDWCPSPTTSPTEAPSTPPSVSPTITPSQSPTTAPSAYPSFSPSVSPSSSPSESPSACADYAAYYNSSDGVDKVSNAYFQSVPSSSDYLHSNHSIIVYNSSNLHAGFDVSCNRSVADICFIDCDSTALCLFATVQPVNDVILDQLVIACTDSRSCDEMIVNVTGSTVERVQIFCNATRSCDDMLLYIESGSSSLSPEVEISCFVDNACDGLTITTDDGMNVELTLSMTRWSDSISIYHLHHENVNLQCGSTDDRRYIRYETDQLLDDDEILDIAREEYPSSNRLPCEDITIYCSNNTDFDYQCTYEYALDIDLEDMLNDNDTADCYWLDLRDVYPADCKGTCGDAMVYNEYLITFDLDIILEGGMDYNDSNATISFLICDEYFGTINDTIESLNSIDVLFAYVLNQIAEYTDIIRRISFGPKSSLRNGFTAQCHNADMNVVGLTIHFRVESAEDDQAAIEELISGNGPFMNASAEILSDFFGIPITLTTILEDLNILGFTTLELGLMGGGVCVFCTLILLLIQYIRYRILEAKTVYIRNAMVIPIGIGEYDLSMKHSNLKIFLPDLTDGVYNDIESMTQFFGDKLKFDVCSQSKPELKSPIKVRWTRDELLQFLSKMANKLQQNLSDAERPYDGLIVLLSCHGMKDGIYTTDYQTITKQSIHRIFSSFPINRSIPRIFVFDSCAGNQRRNENTREEINKLRLENGLTFNAELMKSNLIQRKMTDLENMDPVMQDNPDFKLVQIDGANPDFQAQMSRKLEESFLSRLLIKGLNQTPKRFLFEIMDEVQKCLYEKGIQLIEHRYNNGTGYIKFIADQGIKMNESDTPNPPLLKDKWKASNHVEPENNDEDETSEDIEFEVEMSFQTERLPNDHESRANKIVQEATKKPGIVSKRIVEIEAMNIVNQGMVHQDSVAFEAMAEMVQKYQR